ncbi:MAG: hypothetical protein M9904_03570 [Chitinophagaceae bacterium]|nr:hypothetical protein [Chitinophagaceae bacterium]
MKYLLLFVLFSFQSKMFAQIAKVELSERDSRKSIFITVKWEKGNTKGYGAGCGFEDITELNDSIKLSLLQSLFTILDDTTYYFGSVEPLSYRYRGRYNRRPQSIDYNTQVAALIVINYVAFSSDAVGYSPYPVLYDKKRKKEFSTTCKELNAVIREYRKWFKKIKQTGLKNYSLPLLNKKYEWYGSLYQEQRFFDTSPKWESLYSCPVLIREED